LYWKGCVDMWPFKQESTPITGDLIDWAVREMRSAGTSECAAHPETWKIWKRWNDERLDYPPGQMPMPGEMYGVSLFADDELPIGELRPMTKQ